MPTVRQIEYDAIGAGPTIVVLHGTPGGHDQALAMMQSIASRGYRILAPSRPGYLGTPLEVGRTFTAQADAIAAALDELGEGPFVVAGLSGGGPCAIEMAVRHRARTRAMLLLSAVSERLDTHGSYLARRIALSNPMGAAMRALFALSPRAGTRLLIQGLSTLKGARLMAHVRSIVADPASQEMIRVLLATLGRADERRAGLENDVAQQAAWHRPAVAEIQCPVLVVHGRADSRVPFAQAESFVRECPTAELVPVEDGSHLAQLGPAAAAANARILAFLAEGARKQ
jgi:pimeloyl-ACP methyl ester carboxylesterase